MHGTIQLLGVPIDLGQAQRGVDLGPGAIRYAGLLTRLAALGYEISDGGNIAVPLRDCLASERQVQYLPSIRAVCTATYQEVQELVASGVIPVCLGGDHSLAIGSVGGATHQEPAGVLWIDAHGDFNTPATTLTGNIHGMGLAVLLGDGYPELVNVGRMGAKLAPEDLVLVGVRDLDPGERERLHQRGVTVYTMRDIDERGMGTVIQEALQRLAHRSRLHVSLDMDVLDPQAVPGVGTSVPGGITYREAQLLMESVADCGRLSSLDIVEINPILDCGNQSAIVAVELAASLFGKRIL